MALEEKCRKDVSEWTSHYLVKDSAAFLTCRRNRHMRYKLVMEITVKDFEF